MKPKPRRRVRPASCFLPGAEGEFHVHERFQVVYSSGIPRRSEPARLHRSMGETHVQLRSLPEMEEGMQA